MKLNHLVFIIVATFAYINTTQCDQVLTLFMKPYPVINDTINQQAVARQLREPGAIDKSTIYGSSRKDITSGILSTYHGYLGLSDYNGQTTYPLKQLNPVVYLVVTSRLTPNIITGNTLHHWELETDTPAVMYKVERKKDPITNVSFWETTQEQLPVDNRIPHDAIVIFAKPQYVYVPTGITPTDEAKPNFVLPDLYIKKGIRLYTGPLYVFNIRQFFGPVKFLEQIRDKGYSTLVVPHPGY